MSKIPTMFSKLALSLVVVALLAVPARAAKSVNVTATLSPFCSNCDTDVSLLGSTGDYSLLPDLYGAYSPSSNLESQILTNNSVYTLDTTGTLVNGLVAASTRTVNIHFYSSVEGIYPNDVLPACWGGNHNQDQAVNWSVFASNSVNFPLMSAGTPYAGFARMDFNVRNAQCNQQIFRFYLKWYNVCIRRSSTSPNSWVITSDSCGTQVNYGTAGLYGQGGKNGQTYYYGDWRVPFKLTLTQ
jgi:hypothetical protein